MSSKNRQTAEQYIEAYALVANDKPVADIKKRLSEMSPERIRAYQRGYGDGLRNTQARIENMQDNPRNPNIPPGAGKRMLAADKRQLKAYKAVVDALDDAILPVLQHTEEENLKENADIYSTEDRLNVRSLYKQFRNTVEAGGPVPNRTISMTERDITEKLDGIQVGAKARAANRFIEQNQQMPEKAHRDVPDSSEKITQKKVDTLSGSGGKRRSRRRK